MTTIRRIAHGDDDYRAMLAFRDAVLRRPLGLTLTAEDIAGEEAEFLIAAFEDGRLIGCVLLRPLSTTAVKLRQMGVDPAYQGRGVGRMLVAFAESLACAEGFRAVELNAREVAIRFYEKAGYIGVGEMFTEVTVPHLRMQKILPSRP